MRASAYSAFLALAACASTAWGAAAPRQPHIGYTFPAGGKQGTTFEVAVGGQYLRRAKEVHISGEGVTATVGNHYVNRVNLSREQRQALAATLADLRAQRVEQLKQRGVKVLVPARLLPRPPAAGADGKQAAEPASVELPAHPLLRSLEGLSLRQLQHVQDELFYGRNFQRRQPNAQLGEMLILEVTIDAEAAPGNRELRLITPQGLTNPLRFEVGTLPEITHQEPDDGKTAVYLPAEPAVDLPVLVNGQIMPGDVDHVRFRARQGQNLVVRTHARCLVPFLADAVPGWFQATVTLRDAKGSELAFADDYRFDPDPVLLYKVPADGEYELEIRDAIYRGREDFVYRVSIGELPFITHAFPLGGRAGTETVTAVRGWNLPAEQLPLDTRAEGDWVRAARLRGADALSNNVLYAVDTLPETTEVEPNDSATAAQQVALPVIVNGRIGRPGDTDVFRFEGRAGAEVVAEVVARRLRSPLDSVLRLTDASEKVLEWNDDHMLMDGYLHPDMGLLTHHADSYLRTRLPKDGVYRMHLSDAQRQGGDAVAYRLRISPPQPDFRLQVSPSNLVLAAGRRTPIAVQALRRDGFDGQIELALKDAPEGFWLNGNIPLGRSSTTVTLTVPRGTAGGPPVPLRLEGRARVGDETVVRPAIPCEDMMQAFLWRHLVPAEELVATIRRGGWNPLTFGPEDFDTVQVAADGTAQVYVETARRPQARKLFLEPFAPREGVTLSDVKILPNGLVFQLRLGGEAARAGNAGNLVVEAFTEYEVKDKDGKLTGEKRRASVGMLPAIPFVVAGP